MAGCDNPMQYLKAAIQEEGVAIEAMERSYRLYYKNSTENQPHRCS